MYIDMIPFLEEDYPDRVPQEITNVVLIQNKMKSGKDSESPVTETQAYDHAYGKIDNIVAHKKEIDISTILDPVHSTDNKEPPKPPKVLMDGAPGVGKTTLTLRACKDWAENFLFKEYDLVVLVPLRQASCREAKQLEHLLPGDDVVLKREVVRYIEKNNGKNIAFVFDGYDELSYDQRRRKSLFMRIFCGQVIHKCAVWITSRPYNSRELLNLPSTNRHLEVLGFNKEQIYACVKKRIKDRERASSLIRQLEERVDITSICYIPLLCIIMIRVYEASSNQSLPLTMTDLFERFLHYLLKRHVKRVDTEDDIEDDFESLLDSEVVADQLNILQSLAYKCLIQNKVVFTFNEIKTIYSRQNLRKSDITACSLGLISSSVNISKDDEQYFQFVHLSMQEYLAARHISTRIKDNDLLEMYCRYIDEPRFKLFLLFLAGMSKPSNKDYLNMLFCLEWRKCNSTKSRRLFAASFIYFINLIFESNCFDDFNYLFRSLPDKKELNLCNYTMTLFDCRVLTHFLCSVENNWQYLNMANCSLSVDSLNVMNKVYKCYQSSNRAAICHVNFSGNDPDIVNGLCKFPWLNKLKTLTFGQSPSRDSESDVQVQDSVSCIKFDLSYLAHIPNLSIHDGPIAISTTETLTLCNATLGQGFIEYLNGIKALKLIGVDYHTVEMVIFESGSLKSLVCLEISRVRGLDLDKLISGSAPWFNSLNNLQELSLCETGLTSTAASHLFRSLSLNTTIQKLNLSSNPSMSCSTQDDKLGAALENFLKKNCTLKTLILKHETISDEVAQHLIAGLKVNKALNYLNVHNNEFTIATICSIVVSCNLSRLIAGGISFKSVGSSWVIWRDDEQPMHSNVYCILSELQIYVEYEPVSEIFVTNWDSENIIKFCNLLQRDKSVKCLEWRYTKEVNFGLGCAIQSMLIVNDVLQVIDFYKCSISNSAMPLVENGLANNVSLRKLSLTHFQETNFILCVLRALQKNRSITTLDLSDNGAVLNQTDSSLVASMFKQFLQSNCTVESLELCHTGMNDDIAKGIAEGISMNRSLKTLKVSFATLTSNGSKNILRSSTSSLLSKFEVSEHYLFCRKDDCGWDFFVEDTDFSLVLPQLFHLEESSVVSFRMEDMMLESNQFEKLLHLLHFNKALTAIDLSSHVHFSSSQVGTSRSLGIALKKLILSCSCLKVLALRGCMLPQGTWSYAAEGLRESSLRCLDLSCCGISACDAISILQSIKNIEELNLSDNVGMIDTHYTRELSEAFKKTLTSSLSKIKCLRLSNCVSDDVAKALAISLETTFTSLETLEVCEKQLSCDVIHRFLLLMTGQSSLKKLIFTDSEPYIQFEQSCHLDISRTVIRGMNRRKDRYTDSEPSVSPKLFCGVCTLVLYQHHEKDLPFENITHVKLNDIADDAAIILFRALTHPILSKVKEVTLTTTGDNCNSVVVGQSLKGMLRNNTSLENFSLSGIDINILPLLAEGIESNHHIRKINVSRIAHFERSNDETLAKLLKAINSSKSLSHVDIAELPTLIRKNSWCIEKSHKNLDIWVICSLSNICADNSLTSDVANCILRSCPTFSLDSSPHSFYHNVSVDTDLLTKLFCCLKFNSTLTELNLSGNKELANCFSQELCDAIECMFIENTTLKVLNLVDAVNDNVAKSLINGLQSNRTPRCLSISSNRLEMKTLSMMIHFVEIHSLQSLTLSDVVVISTCRPKIWQIKVSDGVMWSVLLSALCTDSESYPNIQQWALFKDLMEIECVKNGTPIEFYEENGSIFYHLLGRDLLNQDTYSANFNEDDIKYLLKIKGIKGIELSGCFLTSKSFDVLSNQLANVSTHIQNLDLCNSNIHVDGIIKVLEHAFNLKELDVSNNDLSCGDKKALESAMENFLKRSKMIIKLNLASCLVSDSLCVHTGLGMECNTSLLALDLSHNKITDNGMKSFFRSMKRNNSLEVANLSWNPCSSLECILHDFWIENVSLKELNLDSDCHNVDADTLAAVLQGNTTIHTLTLPCVVSNHHHMLKNILLKNNLIQLNLSSSFSLLTTDSKQSWNIEVQDNSNTFANICLAFCNLKLDIGKVNITSTVHEITLRLCHHSLKQMLRVMDSTELNVLSNLRVLFTDHFSDNASVSIASSLGSLLERSSTIKHLELCGAVSDNEITSITAAVASTCTIKEVHVDVHHLSASSIANLMQVFDYSKLNCIVLNSICHCQQHQTTATSSAFISMKSSGSEVEIECVKINDALAIALFQFLKTSSCNIKVLTVASKLINSANAVSNSLQEMLACNKIIEKLDIYNTETESDSIVRAVAIGLENNQTLTKIDINLSKISDESLCILLNSLSRGPLVVNVSLHHRLSLERCISIECHTPSYSKNDFFMRIQPHFDDSFMDIRTRQMLRSTSRRMLYRKFFPTFSANETAIAEHHTFPELEKVLIFLMSCKPKELEVYAFSDSGSSLSEQSSTVRLCKEMICRILSSKSLRTLRLSNSIDTCVIQSVASGLIGNTSLKYLSLNVRSRTPYEYADILDYLALLNEEVLPRLTQNYYHNIKPILLVLHSSCIVILEISGLFLLFRESAYVNEWNMEVLCHDEFNQCFEMLSDVNFNIDKIIGSVSDVELTLCDTNNTINLALLKSMEEGWCLMKELNVIFEGMSCTIDPHVFGVAIEGALANSKCVRKLTITNLANETISEYLVAGIAKNTTLSQIVAKDCWQYPQATHFVYKLQRVHFLNSSIWKVSLCDGISLLRKITYKTVKEVVDDYNYHNDDHIVIPQDGSWIIMAEGAGYRELLNHLSLNSLHRNPIDSLTSSDSLILQCLKKLDFSYSWFMKCTHLMFIFKALQENTTVINLDVSHTVQTTAIGQELSMLYILCGMLTRNKTLKILNVSGLADENILTILAHELHRCSLSSLHISFNTKKSTFEAIEKLISAFIRSNVCCLHIENLCVIHKQCNSEALKSKHVTICINAVCTSRQSQSINFQLLQSFCVLFILAVVSNHISSLALTVSSDINNGFLLKVFRTFFNSESLCASAEQCSKAEVGGADCFVSHIPELHLDISTHSSGLFGAIISALQFSSSLKKIHIYHDGISSKDKILCQLYERLIFTVKTLTYISFDGEFSDILAYAVATGIAHNKTLQSIRFSVANLENDKLANLLSSLFNSLVTDVCISEGCSMKRSGINLPFDVEFTGDKSLLCKLYCVSVQITQRHGVFMAGSFWTNKVLDLRKEHTIAGTVCTIDFSSAMKAAVDGFVSVLRLSGNRDIHLDQRLLMSSTDVLEELYLDNCGITDFDCERIAEVLATNRCLKILDLHSNNITCSGVKVILRAMARNDTLLVLDISGNDFKNDKALLFSDVPGITNVLCQNNSLVNLNLGLCSPLYLDVSSIVSSFTSLHTLSIRIMEEELLVEVFNSLVRCLALKQLNIPNSKAKSISVMVAMQRLLEQNRSIEALDMSSCHVNDEACKILAQGLFENRNMKRLNLSGNMICGHGILALFGVLENNMCSLEELNISSMIGILSSVSQDEINSMSILSTNSSLKVLKVSEFPVDPFNEWFGVKLFDGLKSNVTLSTLDISENVVKIDAFNAFGSMLSSNSTLADLNIVHTEFYWCNYNLANSLLNCTSLKTLTVDQVTGEILDLQNEKLSQQLCITKIVDDYDEY